MLISGRLGELRRHKSAHAIFDILGVQICSRYVEGSDMGGYTTFEMNLVFAESETQRLNLVSHANETALREDARRLADFLGKPVLDHTV